ncbi:MULTISPECIES: hypothetical protein [Streptomyces]|uniref:Uncharacterized protein n=1 Tax=Streptomyces dengpaensis TaxID=2049881 RepID=A0ABM6T476_9ACTN|nr:MULTISPECIES: hypothetical protein [Streptomyces]AVH61772.1 hypothetical protein C4B68_40440 [Streptomyces dengpaensis]PIB05018.1 hypothetical protein B1C81_30345 [Streptomyces sp. HG99]
MPKTAKASVTMTVEPLSQQHIEVLRLADTPHLSNNFDLTIAPYSVWITYRRETGASEYAWDANVSGYRVLANGVVDMDPANIHLWSGPYQQDTPDWLMDLIERFAPTSW